MDQDNAPQQTHNNQQEDNGGTEVPFVHVLTGHRVLCP